MLDIVEVLTDVTVLGEFTRDILVQFSALWNIKNFIHFNTMGE
jgi:hypothetical protein